MHRHTDTCTDTHTYTYEVCDLLCTANHVFTTVKGIIIHHMARPHHNRSVSVRMWRMHSSAALTERTVFWAQDSSRTLRGGSCVCIIDAWCSNAVKADVELFIWRYQTISSPPPRCCCLHSSTSSVNALQNYFLGAHLFVHLSTRGVVYQSFLRMDTCEGISPQNITFFTRSNFVSVATPESVTNSCNNHYNPIRL